MLLDPVRSTDFYLLFSTGKVFDSIYFYSFFSRFVLYLTVSAGRLPTAEYGSYCSLLPKFRLAWASLSLYFYDFL